MYRLILGLILFYVADGHTQGNYFKNRMEFGYNNIDISFGIINVKPNNEYLVFGRTRNQSSNDVYGSVMKLDSNGMPIDTFILGFSQKSIELKNAFQMPNGYLVVGQLLDLTITNGFNPYFIRLNDNLDTLWTKKLDFGSDSIAFVSYSIMCFDSTIATTGIFIDSTGFERILLLKTDSLGNVYFLKSYGYPNEQQNNYWNMDQTLDEGFIIAGSSTYFHPLGNGYNKHLAIKTDSLGNLQWNFPWGRDDNINGGCRVKTMSDSTIIVYTGTPTSGSPTPNVRWNFRKLRYNMSTVWYVEHGPDAQNIGSAGMIEMDDTGFVINRSYLNRLWISRYDSDGNILWSRLNKPSVSQFFGGGSSIAYIESDGGFAYSGYILPQLSLGDTLTQDIFAIKTNCIGWADPPIASATTGSLDNFEVILENNSMYFGNVYINWGDGSADTLYENSDTLIYHTYPSAGNFSAIVIAEACGDADTMQLNIVSSLVGVSEYEKPKFRVYPNPAYETLFIHTDNSISDYKINMTDISGKIILRKENMKQINVSGIECGFYFISIPELNHSEKVQIIR